MKDYVHKQNSCILACRADVIDTVTMHSTYWHWGVIIMMWNSKGILRTLSCQFFFFFSVPWVNCWAESSCLHLCWSLTLNSSRVFFLTLTEISEAISNISLFLLSSSSSLSLHIFQVFSSSLFCCSCLSFTSSFICSHGVHSCRSQHEL